MWRQNFFSLGKLRGKMVDHSESPPTAPNQNLQSSNFDPDPTSSGLDQAVVEAIAQSVQDKLQKHLAFEENKQEEKPSDSIYEEEKKKEEFNSGKEQLEVQEAPNSSSETQNEDEYEFVNENEKVGDDIQGEKKNMKNNANRRYPVRPEAEDCVFYMRSGNCKFGSNCRFNHPVRRKTSQAANEKMKDKEEAAEQAGLAECKYYLRTGGCKYGEACRFNHSKAKFPAIPAETPASPVLELNFLGLPIRLGERECPYYMRNGSCKYGTNCRFNHPDPTAATENDPPSAFGNGGSASLQGSSQASVASWSLPRALNKTAPFMPIMFPPTQGAPPQSPEWNGYPVPVYPPDISVHPRPAYVISNPTTENNVYAHQQQQITVNEFPERPGQPECSFFLKTGDCKFKSNCKYHHPKNRISKSPPCPLSDKGLPLRPDHNICWHYSRYGICKFGPSCKFDHPVQPPSTACGDDRSTTFGNSENKEEVRMVENANGKGAAIEHPL